MSAAKTSSVLHGWETVRFELLNTRVCDLGLRIPRSPVEPFVRRLYREFEAKRLNFRPGVYLTDSWGCPDEVPLIGIPFYLADKRLRRIEEEQTGYIEDAEETMKLLRHEAGHAVNYAYRLWETPGWTEQFGRFSRPYRDTIETNPYSQRFVRHLFHHKFRMNYAQMHPDEDFAESFAVWLTPKSGWRHRFRSGIILGKLGFIDRRMRQLRQKTPLRSSGSPLHPVEEMEVLLAEHYGQRAERYRQEAQGYVDDKLRDLFPRARGEMQRASVLFRRHRRELLSRVERWSGLDEADVQIILSKLEDRAKALKLYYRADQAEAKLLDLTALAVALAKDFGHTGGFSV
jgi:hypothetical protein